MIPPIIKTNGYSSQKKTGIFNLMDELSNRVGQDDRVTRYLMYCIDNFKAGPTTLEDALEWYDSSNFNWTGVPVEPDIEYPAIQPPSFIFIATATKIYFYNAVTLELFARVTHPWGPISVSSANFFGTRRLLIKPLGEERLYHLEPTNLTVTYTYPVNTVGNGNVTYIDVVPYGTTYTVCARTDTGVAGTFTNIYNGSEFVATLNPSTIESLLVLTETPPDGPWELIHKADIRQLAARNKGAHAFVDGSDKFYVNENGLMVGYVPNVQFPYTTMKVLGVAGFDVANSKPQVVLIEAKHSGKTKYYLHREDWYYGTGGGQYVEVSSNLQFLTDMGGNKW